MLGVLSVFTIVTAVSSIESCLMVVPIPLLGMFVSLRSWSRIRRESDQFTGRWLALGWFRVVAGVPDDRAGLRRLVYATEVPDGYTRISFDA